MRQIIHALCFTAHRGECDAAHDMNQTTGNFLDVRGEQDIPVTEEGIHIYNLGVGAGVKGVLTQLSKEGYGLVSPSGTIIEQLDENDKPQDFGAAFSQWLTDPPPPETQGTVMEMAKGGGYEGNTGT